MKLKLMPSILMGFLVLIAPTIHASSIGLRASTLGLGVESTLALHKKVNVRLGINHISLEQDDSVGDVDYEAKLKLQTFSALVDWHPFTGNFRLTGGVLLNRSTLDLNSKVSNTKYEIGDNTYVSNNLLITGRIGYTPVAPYFGLGWGVAPKKNRGWAFSAELGVVYMGTPDVELDASGMASQEVTINGITTTGITIDVGTDAIFQESLAQEEHNLENDIDDYVLFPVVSLGLIFSF